MPLGLRGHLDGVDAGWLSGWACDASGRPVQLSIFLNDILLACLRADQPRPDLAAAGLAPEASGFRVRLPVRLPGDGPCVISVVETASRSLIGGQPLVLPPPEASAGWSVALVAELCEAVTVRAEHSVCADVLGEALVQVLGCAQVLFDRAKALNAAEALHYAKLERVVDELGGLSGSIGHFWGLIRQHYPQIVLPDVPQPRVSVIIPAHNQFKLTYACIEAIARHGAATAFEVILVDDASTDETLLAPLVFGGSVAVRRMPGNVGFLHASNAGAALARGEFLLFLNNDTLVQEGWLDALVETLDREPTTGVVGSALLFPDGRVQDVGGVIWRDGSGWNCGRGEAAMHPAYRHRRSCDYVTGAALMVRAALWRQLGGFDPHFAPAYYEDTDLCFRARQLGHDVAVQPASRVVHLEGQSHGTDLAVGVKRHQRLNMARFRDRWAAVLATHALPGGDLAVAMGRHAPRQALFIDDTTPTPDEDAGSQAALDHMLSLIRLGHQVHFLPADNMAFCPRYTPRLEALGIACWHRPFAQGVEDFLKAHENRFDVVYVHRRRNFAHYGRMIRALQPSARLVFSLADLHALRELREAELERQPPHRLRALRRQLDEEVALACEADAAIVHSRHERALIGAQRPEARVHVVPWSFQPVAEATVAGRAGVAFVGGFRHAPNRDAARWLVEDIWPLVEPRGVDDTLAVIGSHPGREVLALARPGVVVTGKVDDLERALASRRLTVAPLRFGAGVKGKVLTSLADGVPCVMTTMAAEGLDLPQPLRRLVADDAASLAQLINHLLRDDAAWAEASAAGLALIRVENAPCRVDAALAAALAAPAPPPVTALTRMAGRPRRLRA